MFGYMAYSNAILSKEEKENLLNRFKNIKGEI
jgi:DNA-binding FrmR family transcriptional regulator